MLIKDFPLGSYMTNCYIVTDEDSLKTAVIDPGDEAPTVLDYLEANRLELCCILLTHGHFDHTMAVRSLKEEHDVPVYIHKADADASLNFGFSFLERDRLSFYAEGDTVTVGGLTFEVLETPGHTPGSVVLRCGGALFTGDTLFRDSCGRTDLAGGNMRQLLRSLKRLHDLPGDYDVYPGHDRSTTLGRERKFNYYMREACEEQ